MGQSLGTIVQQPPSMDELLYKAAATGDVDAVIALCGEGASLEWTDAEGKTPLIMACMNPKLMDVAKTLIDLGANVDAYRPGLHGGTPLHHAAKRGLEGTVLLLLSHGANSLMLRDDCQTALDLARTEGYTSVVRTIENHICHFSGWLRQIHGPGFLIALAPRLLSTKIWAVVIPRLELAIYPSMQDAQPQAIVDLGKAKIEEPKFHQLDPSLTIYDLSTQTQYKFASANEGDQWKLRCFYNACRGITQVPPPLALVPSSNASVQSAIEDKPPLPSLPNIPHTSNVDGWGGSLDNDGHNGWGVAVGSSHSGASSSGWMDEPAKVDYNGWGMSDSRPNTHRKSKTSNANGWRCSADSNGHNACLVAAGSTHSEASSTGWMDEPAKVDYNGWGMLDSRPNTRRKSEASNENGGGGSADSDGHNVWRVAVGSTHSGASSSGWMDEPAKVDYNRQRMPDSKPNTHHKSEARNTNGWGSFSENASQNGSGVAAESLHSEASDSVLMDEPSKLDNKVMPDSGLICSQSSGQILVDYHHGDQNSGRIRALVSSTPSAPFLDEFSDEGPIQYPTIDLSPVDLSATETEHGAPATSDVKDGAGPSSCSICWEAPVEGACIPCGHMAGCMSCLNEIKAKKGVCPVCRGPIIQVLRLYSV